MARLFRVAAKGGTATPLAVLDPAREEGGHLQPMFLPDGRHFVFGIFGGDSAGTYVASLDSPERKRVSLDVSTMASDRQTSSFSCGTAPSWPSGSI